MYAIYFKVKNNKVLYYKDLLFFTLNFIINL